MAVTIEQPQQRQPATLPVVFFLFVFLTGSFVMSKVDIGVRLYVFTSANHELGFYRADSVKEVRKLSVGDSVRVLNRRAGKFHTVRIETTPTVETLRTADNVPFECFTCYGTN